MPIDQQRVTVKVKENPNNKVTVKTKENLGVNAVKGDDSVGARVLGIPGEQGDQGIQGEQGDTGQQGVPGPVGLNWTGTYDNSRLYQQRDAVEYAGTSYIYTYGLPTSGNAPPDPAFWDVLAGAGTSGDKSYVHVQGLAATTWNIVHNLGKFPSITVIDSANTEVECEVEFVDPNNVIVRVSAAFSGRAYCN